MLYALPQEIETFLKNSTIPKSDVSIYIKETGANGKELISHNVRTTRTPASVIKVLTTYAAAIQLGFDYRFPTRFYTTGKIRRGVLHGDLVVKGYGDPTLGTKDLKKIVSKIKAKGINKINGQIIIDRSYFRVGTKNSSGFDKHVYSPYNAMPDAMMFNERVSTICVTPRMNSVSKKEADESYQVINKLQRVNKPCKGRYSWPGVRVDDKSSVVPNVLLQGKISKHCGTRNICKVVTKPYLTFYYSLKDALKKSGVHVKGNMRLKTVPQQARVLFTHYSKPLEQIIAKTNKKSNNLYARHLLLTLGAKVYGAPATLNKGRKAIENVLKNRGALSAGKLKIDNGSGLSRTAKLSAKMLADMYDHAYHRYGKRWMDTLAIAGVDGTIKKRFRNTVVKQRAWMKTGTLNRVKNIGGYVKSKSGKLYTVVILVESNRGNWRASKLQNDIMKWLVTYKGRGALKPSNNPIEQMDQKELWDLDTQAPDYTYPQKYYVQVGSFSASPTKEYLLKLERLNLRYKVKHASNYKVLVGAYGKEEDARRVLDKVRKHVSKEAFLVKL